VNRRLQWGNEDARPVPGWINEKSRTKKFELRRSEENVSAVVRFGALDGVSNGLSGEIKLRIEEVVEEDDERSHDGGERYFLGLTGGDEALIK
jgi:hypothetical protein